MADKLIRTTVVMSFFLGVALFSGCGANGLYFSDLDNGRLVTPKPGDSISISLESNPTTGYSWYVLEANDSVVSQIGEVDYKSDGTYSEGAGGIETYNFTIVGEGDTTLKLGYLRPWEDAPPIETFTIQIVSQQ